jgi:hypothetical protein
MRFSTSGVFHQTTPPRSLIRVETKKSFRIFVKIFVKIYFLFRFRENFLTKIDENSRNFREIFRYNAKFSIQSDAPFPK